MGFFNFNSKNVNAIAYSYAVAQILNIISCIVIVVASLVLAINEDTTYLMGIIVSIILFVVVNLGLNVIFGMFYDIRMMRICAESQLDKANGTVKTTNGKSSMNKTTAPSRKSSEDKSNVKDKKNENNAYFKSLDITCPKCSETLSFSEEYLSESDYLTCPYCDHEFKANK